MAIIPLFEPDGLLPQGDYEASFAEIRQSVLVLGSGTSSSWDAEWRAKLVDNLEILTRQLWQAGIKEVFTDGSFAEDKDHPNDIDGYFVCDLDALKSGQLTRELNLHTTLGTTPAVAAGLAVETWNLTKLLQMASSCA